MKSSWQFKTSFANKQLMEAFKTKYGTTGGDSQLLPLHILAQHLEN